MNLTTVIDRSRPVFQRTVEVTEAEIIGQTVANLPLRRAATSFARALGAGGSSRDALFTACHVVARSAQDMAEMMHITIPEVHQTCRRLGLNELP